MPLTEIVSKKSVPDSSGGWYWYKSQNGAWRVVEVRPAQGSWPATIVFGTRDVDVAEASGEWGPQIFPPE